MQLQWLRAQMWIFHKMDRIVVRGLYEPAPVHSIWLRLARTRFFQVNVDEAGQLMLTLNGADLVNTVSGRATGASQIVGMAIVETTVINSVLTVRNPAGNATALTITPLAGGTRPVSAHVVIIQLQ